MHGQYPPNERTTSNMKLSFGFGELKGETESLIVAAQDQALKTH